MDLLGSILNSMDKPPTCSEKQKMLRKKQREEFLKRQKAEKELLKKFRADVEKKLNEFLNDGNSRKFEFEPAEKVFRSVIRESAEIAGLPAYTIGEEDEDRRVIVFKKELAPSEEELTALRRGEEWDPEKAKQLAQEIVMQKQEEKQTKKNIQPSSNYMDKYSHIIGTITTNAAAQNKQYGFVPAENKRDQRSIEQTLNDIQNKKKKVKVTEL